MNSIMEELFPELKSLDPVRTNRDIEGSGEMTAEGRSDSERRPLNVGTLSPAPSRNAGTQTDRQPLLETPKMGGRTLLPTPRGRGADAWTGTPGRQRGESKHHLHHSRKLRYCIPAFIMLTPIFIIIVIITIIICRK